MIRKPVRRGPVAHPIRSILLSIGLLASLGVVPPAAAAAPTPVIVAEAKRLSFVDSIEALGTLRANESIALTASVTDTVSALHFDDGDRVEAGKVLVEMTDAEEQAQLREARALLAESESQFRRVQSLATQGTAAKSLLDERAREVQTARARLLAIESRLSDRLIKAPFDGVVGLRDISVGALVEPGDLITTLDDDSVLKLDLSVPSVHLSTLTTGIPVFAKTRAYGERQFEGTVRAIGSRVDPVTRAVTARVLIDNDDRLLKPGMLMRVTLQKNPRDTLVIPEEALMPLGRDQFVYVVTGDGDSLSANRRQITIGSRRPGEVEVLDGLVEGDLVITHGTLRVRPGGAVAIKAVDDGTRPIDELLGGIATAASGDSP